MSHCQQQGNTIETNKCERTYLMQENSRLPPPPLLSKCARCLGLVAGGENRGPETPTPPPITIIFGGGENIINVLNLCFHLITETKETRCRSFFFLCPWHTSWHSKGNQPRMIWQRESDERRSEERRGGGRASEIEERDWSSSGWKCQCAPGYAFYSTCGGRLSCSFSHLWNAL